jgi:hypothetical protein
LHFSFGATTNPSKPKLHKTSFSATLDSQEELYVSPLEQWQPLLSLTSQITILSSCRTAFQSGIPFESSDSHPN